jgi:serine/threonine protein kinase
MVSMTISHYQILRRIGGGAMGVVYEAEDLDLGAMSSPNSLRCTDECPVCDYWP